MERIIEHFARRANGCASSKALAILLDDASREIGFDHYALTICDNLRQSSPRFAHLDNYPPVYAELFVAKRLYLHDHPILLAAQRRIGGFRWNKVGELLRLKSGHGDILKRAAREGLRDGYTVPANVPGEPCGAVSFAARRSRKLTLERRWCADCLGRIAFETSRRLRGLSGTSAGAPELSTREIQCLQLLTTGDIDKQIVRALGISPHTVQQYIKSARASYGARTRTQLVTMAARQPDRFCRRSIPPSGGIVRKPRRCSPWLQSGARVKAVIRIVEGMRDPEHVRALETMFVDRKRLFVDLLGWDVPVVDGRFEIDRFDGEQARYLIAVDDCGDHAGSMRLLPTIHPHILDTLFSELCADGDGICEITRLCLPCRLGAAERLAVRNRLISAMVDDALARGVTSLTGVVQADFRRLVLSMGWYCEPLGPEAMIGNRTLGAFRLWIDAETPERLSVTGIYQAGILLAAAGAVVSGPEAAGPTAAQLTVAV